MHGGSGLSKKQFQDCIKAGIRKINYYSYMSKAGYEAAKKLIESNKTSYLHDVEFEAMKAMEKNVEEAIKIFSMFMRSSAHWSARYSGHNSFRE